MRPIICLSSEPWSRLPGRTQQYMSRLRDGRILRLDDSLQALDELNETLALSGAKLTQGHTNLPLYRAPSLDRALAGQSGLHFRRDDAFRRISRSFHAVKDSEYVLPPSLQKVLRKYQRDGYRWLRTLDGYGMGGILADASESVLAGAGGLKGTVGKVGMLVVLAICLTPFLRLALQYLLYKVTAALCAAVAQPRLSQLIDAIGGAFGLVLGMTGAGALLLLVSLVSAISAVAS